MTQRREVISATSVFGDNYQSLADVVAGRIILIGTSASGLLDIHATPLTPNIAGVRIHAGVIDQILAGQYLTRADWLEGLEILVFAIVAAVLVFVVLRLGPRAGLAVALTAVVAMAAVAWAAFAYRGWQVDASFPVFGALVPMPRLRSAPVPGDSFTNRTSVIGPAAAFTFPTRASHAG